MDKDNIPNSILHCLKAIRLLLEFEGNVTKTLPCSYKANGKCDNCLYYIYRSEGNKECLYEMVQDMISGLTEE